MIDIKQYKPGRFAYLMDKPFARELWDFLADENRLQQMVSATESNNPAITLFLAELESRFETALSSTEYPEEEICVLANNMIRQILEGNDYELIACGICRGRFFKSSGLYQKRSSG